jgi:hypothetical protein
MEAIGLTVDRAELLKALDVLRPLRKRGAKVFPVTLTKRGGELVIQKGGRWKPLSCSIPAVGTWTPLGATVDLLFLRDAIHRATQSEITLHVLEEAILVRLSATMLVRLRLIDFELDRAPPALMSVSLPLFEWAARQEASHKSAHTG